APHVPGEPSRRLADLLDARRRLRADAGDARHGRGDQSYVVSSIAVIRLTVAVKSTLLHEQGGVMVTGGARFLVATMVLSMALFAGCAKRPATTAASAPAPTGAAAITAPSG